MRLTLFPTLLLLILAQVLNAQSGCPGCIVNVPPGLAADTVYLPKLPPGELGKAYDHDISFRMPKTTTPVYALDSVTPPGLPISKIEIVGIAGLPKGLRWQLNQSTFDVSSQTDGCLKICGTPAESDTFFLQVQLKATIASIITKEATFPMKLYIAPKQSVAGGFAMDAVEGCGNATVHFTNNIPSGGQQGFTYEWDFGDGSPIFKGENPPPHNFSKPGIYVVKYKATIDSSPVVLKNVDVLAVECVDQLGLGQPDLYMFITDPNGIRIYDSSPAINNTPLPYTFPVGLTLGPGNYKLEIIDEDSGLKGGDDPCGTVTFNILSGDTLVAGGMTVVLEIENNVQEILSTDTVTVYPNPDKPIVSAPNGLTECGNANTVLLKSNSPADNQWLLSGQPIPGATANTYDPAVSGYYAVRATNAFGCTATSDSSYVGIYPKPATPIYVNVNNLLIVKDSTAFPPALFSLQWYKDNTPIAGATDYRYCTKSSGSYGVEVKDLSTGCSSYYGATMAYNPNVSNCFSSAAEAPFAVLGIFPNPTVGEVQVSLPQPAPQESVYRLWDASGRLVRSGSVAAQTTRFPVDCSGLPAGVYSLELSGDQLRALGKVVLLF